MHEPDKTMTLVGHLTELRKRLLWVVAIFVITMIGGFFSSIYLLDYLRQTPPANGMEWNAFSPWDGVRIYMQFAFVISLVVTLPFALYQLWAFVKPGLRREEQAATLRYIPAAVLFLLAGLAFAYFVVFRMAFYFTTGVNRTIGLTETYGATQYFSFMFNILLPVSLLFELPIVVMFLTKLRILNPLRLKKMRRIAYFVLVVIATIVSPPDLISDILVGVPLLLLYELSVYLSSRVYRKQLEEDLAREAEYAGERAGAE